MKRNTLNYVVDAVTLLDAVGLVATGLLLAFVLPPHSGREGLTLWGMDRHGWGDVHYWVSLAAVGLVAVHLALHWQWVCVTTGRLCTRGKSDLPGRLGRQLAGVGLVLALGVVIGGFLGVAWLNVETDPAAGRQGLGRAAAVETLTEEAIQGNMSFAEIAERSGTRADDLLAALGLPPETDPQARAGRTLRKYGLAMEDLRLAIREMQAEERSE